MSTMTGLDPLEIPLQANPGEAPLLADGWGHISISHCSDALLIGWSSNKIGVDIERKDRKINSKKLSHRFFSKSEHDEIKNLTESKMQEQVLKRWVIKEAAIKWQGGKISTNIDQWSWENNSSFAYNRKLNFQVRVFNQNHKKWTYAIAIDDNLSISNPILCIY